MERQHALIASGITIAITILAIISFIYYNGVIFYTVLAAGLIMGIATLIIINRVESELRHRTEDTTKQSRTAKRKARRTR